MMDTVYIAILNNIQSKFRKLNKSIFCKFIYKETLNIIS